jgi:hypothetical protein
VCLDAPVHTAVIGNEAAYLVSRIRRPGWGRLRPDRKIAETNNNKHNKSKDNKTMRFPHSNHRNLSPFQKGLRLLPTQKLMREMGSFIQRTGVGGGAIVIGVLEMQRSSSIVNLIQQPK